MSVLQDPVEKRRGLEEYHEDFLKTYRRNPGAMSPKTQVEQEKRVRREIANSNERRRMQSINSGFEQIRRMLPPPQEGEKYSKATILQLAVKYIQNLETEANRLANQLKMYSPNSATITNCVPISNAASSLQTSSLNQNPSNPSIGPPRKRKIDDTGNPVDLESLKRRTLPPAPGSKSYEDLNSENVNLRQHVGKLTSDRDSMQRQIDYLRQHLAEVVSSNAAQRQDLSGNGSGNAIGANSPANATMTAYSLPIQTRIPANQPTVQMTIHTQPQGKNSFQVQKVFTNQQQLTQSGALLAQQVQQVVHESPKVKFNGNIQSQQQQHQQQQHQQQQQQQQQQQPPPPPPPQPPQPQQQPQQPALQSSQLSQVSHQPRQQKQQEIITIAAAPAAMNTNVSKPGFEPFPVDPGAVALTRSSESTSPQPLTLTPATPVEHVMPSQPTIPKKSLDALVLAIQQIEGTSMGSTQEDINLLGEKCVPSSEELDVKSNAGSYALANNNNINNNNNNKTESASNISYQQLSAYQVSHAIKQEQVTSHPPAASLEDVTTITSTAPATLPVVTTVTISSTDSDAKCENPSSQAPEHASPSNPTTSEEYPIVTKLLNRPIPHKYLHRPQVVVNSSH